MRRWGPICALVLVAATVGVATATEPLAGAERISSVGLDGDTTRAGSLAAVAYNSMANEYLVTWSADGLATDNEFEIFAQRVTPGGVPLGLSVRVSTTGSDTDTTRTVFSPAVAYNSTTNEYLVTWSADGLATDDKYEIFAQRLSATGTELGGDTRVSHTGADMDATRAAFAPAVAYNTLANEFLVTWTADGLAIDGDFEIFGQRLSATGTEIGGDSRISTTGADADPNRNAASSAVAYNSQGNEYLVVWDADGLTTDDEREVFAQRLSSVGLEVGGDLRVSTTGVDADATRDASEPAVAYNSHANEYLVAWDADGVATNDEFEIFAQRLSATGTDLGGDARVSTTGVEADATRGAFEPSVAYSSQGNEFLVTWEADGLAKEAETEVFAQRLSASGSELGGDTRISTTGVDGDAARDAEASAVAYNSQANEYLVTWNADGLETDDELEIFARRHGAGSSPPSPPSAPPSPVDTVRPLLAFRALTPQRVIRQGGIRVRVGCDERCIVVVQSRVRIAGRPGTLVLRKQTRTTLAGRRVNVHIPLTRTARRALRTALVRGRASTIVLTVTAEDDAANRTRLVSTVRVRDALARS